MTLLTITVTIIVISMVFDQTAITTEARKLRKTNDQDHFKAGSTDDFVPTSPGNSPGVGHKKGNANVEGFQDDFKPTEGRKLQKTNDDFAPTSPGNSPGVGHKKGNANVEGFQDDFKPEEGRRLQKTNGQDHFITGSTDDFAPTSPGHSPGVGHKKGNANVERFKDNFKPTEGRKSHKTNDQKYFKTGSTDDFAPTSPGHSPAIGHKKGNANVEGFKDDFAPTEEKRLQKTNGEKYFKTGSKDDFAPTSLGNSPGMGHKERDGFKPTTPGNSPGIGHAVKNDESKA